MPYLSEKIKIEKTALDRRVKLTADDRELIKWLHEEEEMSMHKLAAKFKVSRRTIQFVIFPERLAQNKEKRAEKGGSKQYYDKDKHREYMKDHRQYKQELKIKGLISDKKKSDK